MSISTIIPFWQEPHKRHSVVPYLRHWGIHICIQYELCARRYCRHRSDFELSAETAHWHGCACLQYPRCAAFAQISMQGVLAEDLSNLADQYILSGYLSTLVSALCRQPTSGSTVWGWNQRFRIVHHLQRRQLYRRKRPDYHVPVQDTPTPVRRPDHPGH